MNRKLVEDLAEIMVERLAPRVLKVEIAGDVRRKAEDVEVLALVIVPRPGEPFMEKGVALEMEDNIGEMKKYWRIADILCEPLSANSTHAVMKPVDGEILIRIHVARTHSYSPTFTPGNFGAVLMFETGPLDFNMRLAGRAAHLGLEYAGTEGVKDANGIVIASETEKEIFSALKMDFVEPEDRQ